MNLQIKYNIGQEVYILKRISVFSEGYFVDKIVPDTTPYKIIAIDIHLCSDRQEIYYQVETKIESIQENLIFSSLNECEKYCEKNVK